MPVLAVYSFGFLMAGLETSVLLTGARLLISGVLPGRFSDSGSLTHEHDSVARVVTRAVIAPAARTPPGRDSLSYFRTTL
jgi:hypothetical protein